MLLLVPCIPVLLILFLLGMEQAETAWFESSVGTTAAGGTDAERHPTTRTADAAPFRTT